VRFDRVSLPRFVGVHLAAASLLHVLSAVCDHRLPFARPASEPPTAWMSLLLDGIVFDTMRYAALVAGRHAADFFVLYQRQRADALKLRAELLEAELTLLRMQLQPHFLFNALHAISELVYRDPRLADRAITRLADLLRGSLATELQAGAPLERELQLLDAYLDIERIRAHHWHRGCGRCARGERAIAAAAADRGERAAPWRARHAGCVRAHRRAYRGCACGAHRG
jgi:hypothetical protein